MTTHLLLLIWLISLDGAVTEPVTSSAAGTDSLPLQKTQATLPSGTIRLWPGPQAFLQSQNQGPENLQISTSVQQVLEDKSGHLWIATGEEGVVFFDGRDYHSIRTENGLAGNSVRTIVQDAAGQVWMATNGGVSRRNANGFTNFTRENGLPDNEVLTLHIDSKGRLWAGTRSGLARFDQEAFTTLPMYQEPRKEKAVPIRTAIRNIYEDKSGHLWFGTEGYGLFKFDGKNLVNVVRPGC
ncbi:two-component regulator propeller domain-containing protein [Flavihumibacter stibioxidans]|uniref:Two component regulator with propeller domain n=1 Tax=Flavihumibacter stibioxidans TaxID=1834163 RepID=A0ABR7M948_9BACT|nr:two-component regulator propeller domain-containing protein [Flavihumibacter stibioxidans]MBC6491532.1 hypothetical protein [Flavihumibacter stibioxidans]